MFDVLAQEGVPVELVTTSEIKVSCLVPRKRLKDAVSSVTVDFACMKQNNSTKELAFFPVSWYP